MSYLENVPLEQLEPHPHNVRRDLGDLTELADSIKGMGLLEPLVVAPKGKPGEGFVVIGGHRRLAAAALAGLEGVPCIMRADLCTPASQIEAMLTENLQRSDLTVMEEADAYAQLELLGVKEVAIAKATGRSKATVHQRLLLAGLPTKRREQYEKGQLSLDGAVMCAKLLQQYADDAEILDLIEKAGEWSFRPAPYGVKSQIDRVLVTRKRAAESPAEADEDDEGDAIPGQSTIDDQVRESERVRKQEAGKAAWARMYDWLSSRVTAQDRTVMSAMLDLAIDIQVTDYDMRGLPELFGIEPAGEDEDVDDANLRIAADLKALDLDDRTMFLAIASADLASPMGGYYLDSRLRSFQALGYALTDDDKTFLTEEES